MAYYGVCRCCMRRLRTGSNFGSVYMSMRFPASYNRVPGDCMSRLRRCIPAAGATGRWLRCRTRRRPCHSTESARTSSPPHAPWARPRRRERRRQAGAGPERASGAWEWYLCRLAATPPSRLSSSAPWLPDGKACRRRRPPGPAPSQRPKQVQETFSSSEISLSNNFQSIIKSGPVEQSRLPYTYGTTKSAGQPLQRIPKTARIADLHKAEKGILAGKTGNNNTDHQETPLCPAAVFYGKTIPL